jgi:two-component system, NtrC family, response regulator GlrR
MQRVYALIRSVAHSDASVLVRGESGTGKELVAKALHQKSRRSGGAFLAINCGALGESTLESELFGHVRGAFTGAVSARKGLFEAASGGTLFLDEVAELSPASQAKLLRTLQEREVRPLGSNESRSIDVRVITATHRDLETMVADGRFREDLYYRVNVVTVHLPPLRERADDIHLLARHFLTKHGSDLELDANALSWLREQPWPGNARQLENLMVRGALAARGRSISVSDLHMGPSPSPRTLATPLPMSSARSEFERAYIDAVLKRAGGNLATAARIAGMDRSNFRRLMRRTGEGSGESI